MNVPSQTPRRPCGLGVFVVAALAMLLGVPAQATAQLTGVENGEWRYLGGDAGHTRSPLSLRSTRPTSTG